MCYIDLDEPNDLLAKSPGTSISNTRVFISNEQDKMDVENDHIGEITDWSQFNVYGSRVPNSYLGSQGVSALVSPGCPMAVVQLPVHTLYGLGLRLGRSLWLICLCLSV
ncbi:hypothetical protein G6F56_011560 [Rhizopus delemar]|nr:hypothetical protein G6F56_011560 [Rhizopus delemar]